MSATHDVNIIPKLKEVREILAKGWTQKVLARTEFKGKEIAFWNPDATCFCILGAIAKATIPEREANPGYDVGVEQAMKNRIYDTLRIRGVKGSSIALYNDTTGRSQSEVLGLIDETIQRLEKETAT
jgi:hypothetical protein